MTALNLSSPLPDTFSFVDELIFARDGYRIFLCFSTVPSIYKGERAPNAALLDLYVLLWEGLWSRYRLPRSASSAAAPGCSLGGYRIVLAPYPSCATRLTVIRLPHSAHALIGADRPQRQDHCPYPSVLQGWPWSCRQRNHPTMHDAYGIGFASSLELP